MQSSRAIWQLSLHSVSVALLLKLFVMTQVFAPYCPISTVPSALQSPPKLLVKPGENECVEPSVTMCLPGARNSGPVPLVTPYARIVPSTATVSHAGISTTLDVPAATLWMVIVKFVLRSTLPMAIWLHG